MSTYNPVNSSEILKPYAVIVEQPTKFVRFRYECENRTASSIQGVNSKKGHKTFPRIRIVGIKGNGHVIVSCVSKDDYAKKYRVHPHKIVWKNLDVHESGVHVVPFSTNNGMDITFENLGIQNTKKNDIPDAITRRENNKTDPFKAGFDHKNSTKDIDLNSLRLCFEVFFYNKEGKPRLLLAPVVSDPIFNNHCLMICNLSRCSAPAAGGTEVQLFCEKLPKNDVEVWLTQPGNDSTFWEKKAEIIHVHKQLVISFKTPAYRDQSINEPVDVFIELRRRSSDERSEPRRFEIYPVIKSAKRIKLDAPIDYIKNKMQCQSSPAAESSWPEAPALNCGKESAPTTASLLQYLSGPNCPVESSSVPPVVFPYWPEANYAVTSPATGSVHHEPAFPVSAKYYQTYTCPNPPLGIQDGNLVAGRTMTQVVNEQNWTGQYQHHEFYQSNPVNVYNNNINNNVEMDGELNGQKYQVQAGSHQPHGGCLSLGGFDQQVPGNQDIGPANDQNDHFLEDLSTSVELFFKENSRSSYDFLQEL